MGMVNALFSVTPLLVSLSVAAPPVAQRSDTDSSTAEVERDPGRTAVRGTAFVQGIDFAGAGAEVSTELAPWFAVQGTFGGVNLGRGYGGIYGEAMARFGMFGTNHSVSAGLGLAGLESSSFGDVGFFVPEVAYEYRPRGGFSVSLGLAAPVTLNDSYEVPCEQSGFLSCFLDKTQFHQGETTVRARLALGYSF
jgi:hypothetical protein